MRRNGFSLILKLAALAAGIGIILYLVYSWSPVVAWEPDMEFPMTNQHIEWSGAGYR